MQAHGTATTSSCSPLALARCFACTAEGGTPAQLTKLDPTRQETAHRHPWFLPDGRHFLYAATSTSAETMVYVGSLDQDMKVPVVQSDTGAIFAEGYLLFVRQSTLLAQSFDLDGAEDLRGPRRPGAEHFQYSKYGKRQFFGGRQGCLVVLGRLPGPDATGVGQSRRGRARTSRASLPIRQGSSSRRTGNASRSACTTPRGIAATSGSTISRGTREPACHPPSETAGAPAGRQPVIALCSAHDVRGCSISIRNRQTAEAASKSWARRWGTTDTRIAGQRIFSCITQGEVDPRPATISGPYRCQAISHRDRSSERRPTNRTPRFSRDGRWVAFTSDESGREEVFVVPFPGPGGRVPISTEGGTNPRWRQDGTEIFYLSPRLTLMAAAVNGQNSEFEVRDRQPALRGGLQNRELSGLWPWVGLRRGAGWTAVLDQSRHRHGAARTNDDYDRHELDILSARRPLTA